MSSRAGAARRRTCFCDPPLEEERPHWEKYFDLLAVKGAHARRNCRHENGTEAWACCDCDCTEKLEAKLRSQGESFFGDAAGAGAPEILLMLMILLLILPGQTGGGSGQE